MVSKVQIWRQKTKKLIVMGFGGKCNKCGYSKCFSCLDCHHINPLDKKFTISKSLVCPTEWTIIIEEVKKCVLLCKNCHGELHAGLWKIEDIVLYQFQDLKEYQEPDIPTGICPVCNVDVYYGAKCCSKKCSGKLARKIVWPDNKDLLLMLENTSKVEIGKRLGVSEAAVRKHIAKYCQIAQ